MKNGKEVQEVTCIIPFTRQTLCFKTTICESSGCKLRSSSLTDSTLALCSIDNWIAVTPLPALSTLPKTTRESPALATYRSPLHITPTKQHVPTEAICGFIDHCCLTRERNSSSVAKKAFLITLADISWSSEACSVRRTRSRKTQFECTYFGDLCFRSRNLFKYQCSEIYFTCSISMKPELQENKSTKRFMIMTHCWFLMSIVFLLGKFELVITMLVVRKKQDLCHYSSVIQAYVEEVERFDTRLLPNGLRPDLCQSENKIMQEFYCKQ